MSIRYQERMAEYRWSDRDTLQEKWLVLLYGMDDFEEEWRDVEGMDVPAMQDPLYND